jgi:hypothetical protein
MGLGCVALLGGYCLALGLIALQLWPDWAQPPVGEDMRLLEQRVAEESIRLAAPLSATFVALHVLAIAGLWISVRALRESAAQRGKAMAGAVLTSMCCLLLLWAWVALFVQMATM